MSKKLVFERRERVTQTYEYSFNAKDWTDLVKSIKISNPYAYEHIKDLTFDEVIEEYARYQNDNSSITWKEPFYSGSEESYDECLGSFLDDCIREMSIDAGPVDEEYFDDYDEYVSIENIPD